ncbi:MAG: hypothetical protein P4L92_14465 [Rudaea sp.]|nr:hypothetical protein [Rudaea sp.]
MRKYSALGAGALLALSVLICGNAFANGTFAVTLADYNSAQVAQNGGVVTYPVYSTVNATFYNAEYTLTSGTELEAGSNLTVTLPAGFTFNTNPSLYFFQSGSYAYPVAGSGAGYQSATFKVVTAVTNTADPVIIYPAFSVNTGAALSSQYGGNPLSLSIQATGNAAAGNNDASPVSQPAFTHAVGSLPDTITPGSGQINLANPYYGDQFVASGNTSADSGFVAVFAINTETADPFNANAPVLQPNGALNVLTPSDTANITVEGYFNGIGLAYANTNTGGVCQGSVPSGAGVYTGTASNGSISFTGVPINTPVQICMIPYGVMWASDEQHVYVYTYSAGAGVTDFFGGLAQTTANNFYTYAASATTVVDVVAGSPQSATVGSGFCTPLAVKVYDTSTNYLLKGIDVIFDAPQTGQSGSFAGSGDSILVGTGANGVAVSSFAANSTAGVYTVTANVGTVQGVFGLTNEPGVSDQVFCNGFEY